jgi:aldehyde dehydrogenase (NAD+)
VKRTFLELGGKSALIVLDDATPARILPGAIGVLAHAGQACAMTTRLIIHESLVVQAVTDIAAAFESVPVGDPASPTTFVGPLISAAAQRKVLAACEQARRDGAEIVTGGGLVDGLPGHLAGGHFVAPTLIVGVDNDAAIAREEIFGPVLVVIPFAEDDDAVRIANDSVFGLAGAVLSSSLDRGMSVAHRVRTGSIGVNGGMFYGADAPFGGYKSSGLGRQCGIEGFEQYLETKTIAHRIPRGAQSVT